MKDSSERAHELLSSGPVGRVYVCPAGCLHVNAGNVSLRFSRNEYRELVAMLSAALSKLPGSGEATVH